MTADTRLWHPFANMSDVRSDELVLTRADGVWLWDRDDRRYLDATSSLWYVNVGHRRTEIADAVRDQLLELDAYSIFGDYANEPALALAERLAGLAPVDDARVFLTCGGGEAIDSAGKIARRFFAAQGHPERVHLIGRTHGFHGTYGLGTSIGGIEANREGFGPLLGETSTVAWDSVEALEARIAELGPERVAAFFVEPIIGAGGVLLPPEGYLEGVAEVCRRAGVLLVVDAIICAFGRLGTWFGIERWGVRPDMITFAKGVTSGYQPLGGVVVSGAVAAPFWEGDGVLLRHGPTYAGHPAACAAALANLDILEREGLLARAGELEGALAEQVRPLADHPLVGEVRAGTGVVAAVELSAEAHERGVTVPAIAAAARAEGVLVRPLATSVAVSPPLTITADELAEIGRALQAAFDAAAVAA